jgi:ABC-2 type transport system ATP-binding protein
MSAIISFKNITKHFGPIPVLKGVDLELMEGEALGLLGVNGAGKTTLLRVLLGLLKPDSGTISFNGNILTLREVSADFGFLPENFMPPPNFKAGEFLDILSLQVGAGRNDAEKVLEITGLKKQSGKYLKHYSRGMIQRIGIAAALLKDPKVLVLDEPALGLDPLGQKNLLDIMEGLRLQGKTIFFSSHTISQIEKACQRIAVLNNGRIVFEGAYQGFKEKHRAGSLEDAFLKEVL